jgi:formylglycine-generating enzyme required for sulfatase activity
MSEQPLVRIFISSPADVHPERLKAEQIIKRLDREFAYHHRVEAVLWEREPLVADRHFQDPKNILPPRRADIVVVILWSQLGVLLPEGQFRGAISGRPVTGTEWEFEDAIAGARERGVPDVLFYRKTAEPVRGLGDRSAVEQRLHQLDLVKSFISEWFRSADDRSFTAALHSFADTAEFEAQLYDHLRALMERRAGENASVGSIRWHDNPFRGLLSFEYAHAPIFFGRTRARNEVRELLARQVAAGCAFVMVLGASGTGKSSVVKAGLLPDLLLPGMIERVGLVRWSVLRPSDSPNRPLDALAAAILSQTALPELLGLQYSQEQLASLLLEAPGQATLPIRQGLAAAGAAAGLTETAEARLTLVIDQLEELFTISGLDQQARRSFVAALEALARSGLVWVVATMRSDYFHRLEGLPELAALSAEARYLLLPPSDAEIGQMIREPAREAGLRFEVDAARGFGLDDVIRQATGAARGALPLLSFLLENLWRRRSEAGVLTFAAYDELGGLEGAIGRRAEEVFLTLPEAVQREGIPVMRALVKIEGRTPVSQTAPLAQFAAGSRRREFVDAFLAPEARLLVVDADAGGEARLRLAHEALLSHWPRARDQVAADARDIELRGRLEEEAQRWREAQGREKPKRVIAGLVLAEARDLLARWGAELPGEVRDYVVASRRAARMRAFRLASILAGMAVALPVIACLFWTATVWWGVRQVEAGMVFVPVPAGCFAMGSPDSEVVRDPNEGPVHKVCLQNFQLGRFEVTQGQWRRVMVFPNNPYPSDFAGSDKFPVNRVSWNEAQRFVRLMSFFGRYRYHLPSEAQYEYAARAGTTTSRYWGDNIADGCIYENIPDRALKKEKPAAVITDCDDGYAWIAPVGTYKPNPFGINDILGNVAEWVDDCYADNYSHTPTDGSPNLAGSCTERVVRGGAHLWSPQNVRAANRFNSAPENRGSSDSGFGFRVTRTSGH